jgi:iron complex outermembrane receptor protein
MSSSKVFLIPLFMTAAAFGAEPESLPGIEVSTPQTNETLTSAQNTSDTASMLNMTPGVSLKTGGGLSSLPVIHGMADDRINIKIDGASSTSSCPNHMNPALSYIDPSKVGSIETMAGITPVSYGGDSIGGSIIVRSKDLVFAESGVKQNLNFMTYFKSNNENSGASVNAGIATKKFFIGYSGFDEKANNYRNGRGDRIKSTLFNQNNQTATVGRKLGEGVLSLKLTRAAVPYEGFVNQYMDMTDNVSNQGKLNYKGLLGEVLLDSTVFYQHTNHYMDMIHSQRSGNMPMYTRSDEAGYNIKGTFELNKYHTMTVGSDLDSYRLDDWWPGVPNSMMMGPGTFQSINNGKRDRLGLFVEADSDWTNTFSTNLGLRTDIVSMNTSDVQGYNNSNNLPADADVFNSKSHSKRDHNYDATSLAKLKLSPKSDVELGFARKTRSPNLYERYAWAGLASDPTSMGGMGASMDMVMINWFGDGNGYVGNVNLKPEVAHTLSASYIAHDDFSKEWEVKLTPYYTEVQNFIDADVLAKGTTKNYLTFANHDAVIMGADLSARALLSRTFSIKAVGGYTRGYRKDSKAELYHMMPLNGRITLQHASGKWMSDLTTTLVAKKEQVNDLRLEPATAGYALLDISTSYQVSKLVKVDFAITNLLDHTYAMPLGGIDLVNHSVASHTPVSCFGRSVNTAVSIDFF